MAAELITPVDSLTGVPLPILPREILPIDNPEVANMHHAWHPSSDPRLLTTAGLALRHSRVQLVRATDHNMGDKNRGKLTYHDFYEGPPLPEDETEIFRMCVLSCAGYLPDKAIDLHKATPREITMNPQQIEILRKAAVPQDVRRDEKLAARDRARELYKIFENPGVPEKEYVAQSVEDFIRRRKAQAGFHFRHVVYRYEPIRKFFTEYTFAQDFTRASEARLDQFLFTNKPEDKVKIGKWLLALAVGQTADPVQSTYSELRRNGKLHPRMPADVRELIWFKLGSPEQHAKLMSTVEKEVRAQLKIA